jgi:hypothetical protein
LDSYIRFQIPSTAYPHILVIIAGVKFRFTGKIIGLPQSFPPGGDIVIHISPLSDLAAGHKVPRAAGVDGLHVWPPIVLAPYGKPWPSPKSSTGYTIYRGPIDANAHGGLFPSPSDFRRHR